MSLRAFWTLSVRLVRATRAPFSLRPTGASKLGHEVLHLESCEPFVPHDHSLRFELFASHDHSLLLELRVVLCSGAGYCLTTVSRPRARSFTDRREEKLISAHSLFACLLVVSFSTSSIYKVRRSRAAKRVRWFSKTSAPFLREV